VLALAAQAALSIAAAAETHWSFQPPRVAPPNGGAAPDEHASPVDRYVEAALAARGLTPSPRADARVLLRRVSYALTGLPPTPEELAALAADDSPAAYASAVDRLLASPAFGERWGRHWLDLARYSDSKGYVFQEDRSYRGAYRYRDWVVASFNADLPYDQFVVAQLAADQTPAADDEAALGFLTLGRRFLNNPHDIIDDRIDLVTRGLLGLSVACARCHDHFYDPISSADYYALYGVFASTVETPRDDLPPQLADAAQPSEPAIFLRGSPDQRGPTVPRRFLACLSAGEPVPFAEGSGRRELAEAIASPQNPLTARVWVNRIWAQLWGQGLVATASDFGSRGEPPTHPELLDWLAVRLVERHWSTKQLIRELVTSRTYCQASDARPAELAADPDNRLVWRANRRRLDLEAYRDSLLVAAGRLDRQLGGPPVDLLQQPFPVRRALYGTIDRQNLPEFYRTFDFANPNTHSAARPETLTPQQALFALNDPFVLEQARHLASRVQGAAVPGEDAPGDGVRRLYRFALGRAPEPGEVAELAAFLPRAEGAEGGSTSAWEQAAQAVLISNEFAFVD
jgi:hypothetical protein